jgi:DNA-binding response OmpR family regulator
MSSGSPPLEHTPRVAIIEDEADIAGLLAHCFACEGFQVMTAQDGVVGLDVIRRNRPDLIVLDLMLPTMSGWEVFRSVKANRSLQNIPVVVLSANSDVANRISLLEEGVDDYIVKPCSVREVIARARAVLRRGERTNPGREGGA